MNKVLAKKEMMKIDADTPEQKHRREMWRLTDKLSPKIVGSVIKSFKKEKVSKKGGNIALDVIQRILKESSPEEIASLAGFMVAAHNSDYTYKYHLAELVRRWGSESYFAPYMLSGNTKYELVTPDARVYRKFSKIVYGVKKQQKSKDRLIDLSGIVKANDGEHYVAMVTGGNNGCSNWSAYLETIRKIVDSCKHAWVVEMSQHSDVYYVLIGFEA